ncbi:uncharacterized protein PAC_17314 [Phialocephala subalpina]|uniref:INSIG domain protein n=1 Tax=Phialocephala subalpina TaxID=576137 RepID=A0A1L7XQY3_9HELO|nr:uncharacterized protein PAC_17314 [Phialocephala subalpina]
MSTPSSPTLKIHRPKPRRPFETQSSSTSTSTLPPQNPSSSYLSPNTNAAGEPLSRTQSILNLTSSTLLGIYSPTGYQNDFEYSTPSTPWGTGAETPSSHRPSQPIRRHTSPPPQIPTRTTVWTIGALFLRGVLLFTIGMGYGLLVRHLHDDRQLAPFQVEGIIKPRNDWRYLAFWGVAGVGLGSLMPVVDTLFSIPDEKAGKRDEAREKEEGEEETGIFGADWTPVVRSVGAFVGIAYAIRKLPWATPLQASLTLFLVNPVLWYLIDRSAPGFILSASVGAVGTSLLLASNPDMMPSPASATSVPRNFSTALKNTSSWGGAGVLDGVNEWAGEVISRESFEVGIWILSVLFCSCVCFGNVGRRLALRSSSSRTQKLR